MNTLLTKKNNKPAALVLLIVLVIFLLAGKLFFFGKRNVLIFNHAAFFVVSSSMLPEYPVNTLVVINKIPYSKLKAGDVIAYRSAALSGRLAFHRITRVTKDGFYTKGDNNNYEDNQIVTQENYVGKGVLKISFFARYFAALSKPAGFILFLLLPLVSGAGLYFSIQYLRTCFNGFEKGKKEFF